MSEMVVYVLRNGEEVSRAKADKNGNFSFDGLRPGVYGFVAAGSSGFAATSFQLVGSEIASVGNDGNRFVSSNGNVFLGHACRKMNVEVVPCCEVTVCEQPVQTIVQEPCAVPVDKCGTAPTCGCGGGFGGGGGGGGGIGGLGGLAAIGGLIAVGAIAASDNNNNAPIVSPVTP